jgi:hypothetical protein
LRRKCLYRWYNATIYDANSVFIQFVGRIVIGNITFYAKDTWIEQSNRLQNHNGDGSLIVEGVNRARTVLLFEDIRRRVLQEGLLNPTIINATLRLWLAGDFGVGGGWNDNITLHLLNKRFVDYQANWECALYDNNGILIQTIFLSNDKNQKIAAINGDNWDCHHKFPQFTRRSLVTPYISLQGPISG